MTGERGAVEGARQPGHGPWLEQLRRRFVEISARRVEPAAVEDVAQEALRIVVEKYGGERPRLESCFQVLRNVIGNHYSRQRTRKRFLVPDGDGELASSMPVAPRALAALEEDEAVGLLRRGIEETGSPCRDYLTRLARGSSPASIAEGAGLEAAAFYRRLYRCRKKLRQWLAERGVHA